MGENIIPLISMFFLGFYTLILVSNVVFGPFMRRIIPADTSPNVSVLIPARNEQENIGSCLNAFLVQDYPDFEILVLDDHSEDGTADVVKKMSEKNEKIQLISGSSLPAGWLGKNWACMQLQKKARGEILLFADADTSPSASAISKTVAWITKYRLGLFSVFPQQTTISFSEKLLVPLIDFILYTMLPLWAIYYFKSTQFAAANGQWIAFTRSAYERIGTHEAVRQEVVEDVSFSKKAKLNRIRTITAAGTGMVYCRMYKNFHEIWHGLSKNFYGLMGNNIMVLILVIAVMSLAYLLPYLSLLSIISIKTGFLALILIIFIRVVLSITYKHHILIGMIFHPIMILIGIFIALNSFYITKKNRILWKGRYI